MELEVRAEAYRKLATTAPRTRALTAFQPSLGAPLGVSVSVVCLDMQATKGNMQHLPVIGSNSLLPTHCSTYYLKFILY